MMPRGAGIGRHDEVLRYFRSDRRAAGGGERRKAVDHLLYQGREGGRLGRDVRRLPVKPIISHYKGDLLAATDALDGEPALGVCLDRPRPKG